VANAAIVPAGTDGSGSINVFASNNTDIVIDINGYYAAQSGTTLNSFNTGFGLGALATGGGYDNTAIGNSALASNTTGFNDTAIGFGALLSNNGGHN